MAVSKSAGVCRSSRWCFSFWNLKVNVLIQLVFIFNTVLRNTEMPGETKGLGHGPLLVCTVGAVRRLGCHAGAFGDLR